MYVCNLFDKFGHTVGTEALASAASLVASVAPHSVASRRVASCRAADIGNHKESINTSATTITKSAINHKHQKGLKSTLHLPKLEYPCFSLTRKY